MNAFNLLIDGRLVPGAASMPVINPATEEVLANAPRADLARLNADAPPAGPEDALRYKVVRVPQDLEE
jgi:hypothetical protein